MFIYFFNLVFTYKTYYIEIVIKVSIHRVIE